MGTAARTALTPSIAELIYDTDLSALFVGDGSTLGGIFVGTTPPYILAPNALTGVLTNSQLLLFHRMPAAMILPANFGSYLGLASKAGGSANATASTVINADKALNASPLTFSNVGTITIGAGTIAPTFSTSGAVTFAAGDVLRIQGPATADTTFADFYATLIFKRSAVP